MGSGSVLQTSEGQRDEGARHWGSDTRGSLGQLMPAQMKLGLGSGWDESLRSPG